MYRLRKAEKHYIKQRKLHSSAGGECAFCEFTPKHKQIKKSFPHFFVARNIYPYNIWDDHEVSDHLMIVPRRHIVGIHEYSKAEKQEFADIVGEYEAKGYSLFARAPENKQKTIAHQHTHLIKLTGAPKNIQIGIKKPYIFWVR